jgi:hypothetical protein
MCARSPIGRKEFAIAVGLWAFLLASGAARSAGLEVGSEDGKASPDASANAAGLDSCAIQADTGGGVCSDPSGEERAAPPHLAGADEPGASRPVARAGEEELAPSEVVCDPSLEPGGTGSVQLPRTLATRLGDALDQKAARAADGALASLEAREAERVQELTRSVAGRVRQDLAGGVERRLLPAPSGTEEFVAYARREVSRPSADAAAGTASEITPPASVDGGSDPPSTIAVGVAHSPAIAAAVLPLDMDAWCRESTRGR